MWLYHRCPPEMVGQTIVPLRQLRALSRKHYVREQAKYTGREWVREQHIPTLNCYWDEVVFLSAVPPVILRAKLERAGFHPAPAMYYKIDPKALDPECATVLLWDEGTGDHYVPYRPEDMELYQSIPVATEQYYEASKYASDEMPLLHAFVPQILYRGEIDAGYAHTVPF